MTQMDGTPDTIQLMVTTAEYDTEIDGLREKGHYIIRALGVREHKVTVGMLNNLSFKKGEEHPINQILDQLLPLPEGNQAPVAKAVVSTERTSRWPTIPDPDLMVELGKRVANARSKFVENPERKHVPTNTPQPQRTDLEGQVTQTPEMPVPYIEIEFPTA